MLKNKNILLGISGGIAAYKTAPLTRLLIKNGASVKVIMTEKAKEFITPLTMATLSKNPILVDFYNPENGDWNSHVDLGLWADAMVIAPATANTMGKMANAIADNLLVTTYLSARCPVFIAPTMDLDMYKHPANTNNMKTLEGFGNIMIEPNTGELASGLVGKGRMAEPEEIVNTLEIYFNTNSALKGKNVLITAGPTHEAIDPVRFIGNQSSGKMGFSIAEELAKQGAMVNLICGPNSLITKNKNITRHNVTSAEEMYKKCAELFNSCSIAIMSAAVADYTPEVVSSKKIKKSDANLTIKLKKTKDIAAELGKIKNNNQLLIGFALETDNEIKNAESKLENKNLDFIVLNSLNDKGAGFKSDTNKITIITRKGETIPFDLKSKTDVAIDIVNFLKEYTNTNK